MPWAEFEEKQYETAANNEFAIGNSEVYASGPVAEALLAYDVALHTRMPAIWQLIGTLIPAGAMLVPNYWAGFKDRPKSVTLPSRYVTLILQYKRPMYLKRRKARQWKHWHAPFYRVDLDGDQHRRLRRLEANLSGAAAVRYAAPVFHRRTHLETHQINRTVLASSNFVSPLAIGSGHRIYSYREAGNQGFSNEEPTIIRAEDFRHLMEFSISQATEETLLQHLQRVAAAVQRGQLLQLQRQRVLTAAAEVTPEVRPETADAFANLAVSCAEIGEIGATWWIADFGPTPQKATS
jgi:hypothetical protein